MTNTNQTITLRGTTYTILHRGEHGMDLRGKRGARYTLVQNIRNPEMFALIRSNTLRPRAEWYRKAPPNR